ncbi:Mpo1 family 2-hydroxy fatty acid dioxygenase [Pseudoalteromonas xiamenensis]
MKTLVEQLCQYARYHRDKRNIATHFIGIPLIVIAVMYLLYFPVLEVGSFTVTATLVVIALSLVYYLMLSLSLGFAMAAAFAAMYAIVCYSAPYLGSFSHYGMFIMGVILFVVGWIFQFVGHYYEGKKPAFVDDLIGLAIGPLFVMAEFLFILGFHKPLEQDIIREAGEYR